MKPCILWWYFGDPFPFIVPKPFSCYDNWFPWCWITYLCSSQSFGSPLGYVLELRQLSIIILIRVIIVARFIVQRFAYGIRCWTPTISFIEINVIRPIDQEVIIQFYRSWWLRNLLSQLRLLIEIVLIIWLFLFLDKVSHQYALVHLMVVGC